jgi:hypothetical protein
MLGERTYAFDGNDMRHRHHRTFFHAATTDDPTRQWQHWEDKRDDGGEPILFELFWLPFALPIPLVVEFDALLPQLRQRLGLADPSSPPRLHQYGRDRTPTALSAKATCAAGGSAARPFSPPL